MANTAGSKPRDRTKRLVRLIRIVDSGEPKTVEDLTQILGVSRRTVLRDLELLSEAGVNAQSDPVSALSSS